NVVGGLKDGTSWANAFDELSLALDASWVAGDTFWVANGTYTSSTIEPWSFHIQPGCAVYGGFDGSETQRSQRNWQSFQTVLSGANAYGQAVVLCDQNGLLDGFKITHSAAPTQQRTHTGVIMYLNTTIANCQFTNLHNVSKVHAVNISSVAFSA